MQNPLSNDDLALSTHSNGVALFIAGPYIALNKVGGEELLPLSDIIPLVFIQLHSVARILSNILVSDLIFPTSAAIGS